METTLLLDGESKIVTYNNLSENQLQFTIEGREYPVTLLQLEDGRVEFRVHQQNVTAFVSEAVQGGFHVNHQGNHWHVQEKTLDSLGGTAESGQGGDATQIHAPFPGKIIKIMVTKGEPVKKGKVLILMEAMKLETPLEAKADGVVEEILTTEGAGIEANTLLMTLSIPEES